MNEPLRQRILAACDQKYRAARFRDATGKAAARGMLHAMELVRAAQDDDPQALKERLQDEKRAARERPDDEDGWYVGGIQTVINVVEEQARRSRRTRRLWVWSAGAIVALAVVMIASAMYTHVPGARLAGSDAAAIAAAVRAEIEEEPAKKRPAERRETPYGPVVITVQPGGEIQVVNTRHGIELRLRPGADGWRCSGSPAAALPPACR